MILLFKVKKTKYTFVLCNPLEVFLCENRFKTLLKFDSYFDTKSGVLLLKYSLK